MMSWDRKLRKLIAEQTKPRITFKEFCEKHGIELPANYVAQTNTNEKVNVFALRVTSLCVLGIAAIIAIMFLFIPKNNFKYYYNDMIKKERINYEELLKLITYPSLRCHWDITDDNHVYRITERQIAIQISNYRYFVLSTDRAIDRNRPCFLCFSA